MVGAKGREVVGTKTCRALKAMVRHIVDAHMFVE
jgi:hypothetical protein